jgi:hypothetical protein
MVDALAVQEVAEVRREAQKKDAKRRDVSAEEELNLLDRVVEFRDRAGPVPGLLVFHPTALLIPGGNKVLHCANPPSYMKNR